MIRQCLLLSVLFIIHGCGTRNQTETTLKVSNSFSITSRGYTGGLIIHGKNLSTEEKFTQSLKDGVQFTAILNKGEWLLSAIGWRGDSKFNGTPHCGKVNTKLSNEQETVYISMNSTNCGDPFFPKGEVDSEKNIKKINFIGTCDTFFEKVPLPTDTISTVIVGTTTSKDFCDDPNFPADLKSKVSSIKIFGLNKKPHELSYSFGFESDCMGRDLNSTSTFSLKNLILPLNEIPLAIKTYEDIDCKNPIAEFMFKDGLVQGDTTEFDHLLLDDLSSSTQAAGTPPPLKLILPSNDLKRGLSPFSALAPSFIKVSSEVTSLYETTPPALTIYDYRIPSSQESIVLEDEEGCDKIQTPYNESCSIKNEMVMIDIGTNTEAKKVTITTSEPNSESKRYNFHIEHPGFDQERSEAQRLIMKLIGHNADEKTARFFNVWEDNSQYGYLSEIRQMFHPESAGGVLGIKDQDKTFEDACRDIVDEKEIRFLNYEDKKDKWYKVVISNIDNDEKTPSKFLCNLTNLNPVTCSDQIILHKKMTIYNQNSSKDKPHIILKFSCTHNIGHFEILNLGDDNQNSEESLKRIINWNTDAKTPSAYQRFEIITWIQGKKPKDETWENKTMARVFKTSNSDFEGLSYELNKNNNEPEFTKSTFFKLESSTNNQNKLTFKTIQNDNTANYSFILNSNYPQADLTTHNPTIVFKPPEDYVSFNDSLPFTHDILADEKFESEFKLDPAPP